MTTCRTPRRACGLKSRDEAPTVRFATPQRPERPILEDALEEAWDRVVEEQISPRQSQPHSGPVHRPRQRKAT